MKITGKNAAIGTSAEDVWTKGGSFSEPTEARIHALVSNSVEDDANGTLQVETATVAGTIDGTKQVETAIIVGTIAGIYQVETSTVVGTIDPAGTGNALVTITSALFAEPLEVSVAVANDDDASAVAGKIRTALNAETDITDNFTVGGSDANVSLTAKAYADNDETLNIAIDNDTCTGLTAAPTSANTTAGNAGTGTCLVTVTSALFDDDEVIAVDVAIDDDASAVATKVRAAYEL